MSADRSKTKSQWLVIRETVSKPSKIILGTIPILVILTIWQFCTTGSPESRIISPLILPSPLEVISPATIHAVWFEAELSRSIVASTMRVVFGFLIGCGIAFPLAIMMGSFSKVNALFEPGALFLSYLPIPALVPLTMSLFGIGETQKIMFLALAFLIYLIPLLVKAVNDVDNVYLQTAYTLGVKRWNMVRKVLIPIALPQIYQAMRMGFGVGWTYIILAEMVAADRGLGQIIIIAQRRAYVSRIYLVLLVIVIIAFLTDKLWEYGYKKFFPYKRAR